MDECVGMDFGRAVAQGVYRHGCEINVDAVPHPVPPVPPQRPHVLSLHGDERVDPWYWLREKESGDVIAHLEAENAYTQSVTGHTEELQGLLFEEIRSRIQETDLSLPARKAGWWYYSRTVEGLQYPIHCRRPDSGGEPGGEEAIVLDENLEAADSDFFQLGIFEVSPAQTILAYGTDFDGDEIFTIRFRDLASMSELPDTIEGAYYGSAWGNDNTTFFYVRMDEAHRPHQLWRHRLGTPQADDQLVFEEPDERFFLGVDRTRDDRMVLLQLESKVTTEWWWLDADEPGGEFTVIHPREQGLEYSADHHEGRFLIVTNADEAYDFKLVETPVAAPGRENWRDVVAHRPGTRLDGIDVFANHLVMLERHEATQRLVVRRFSDGETHAISQPEEVSTAGFGTNAEYETTTYRYTYTSLVTPRSIYDYELDERTRELKKQQPVLGGYDPSDYETGRTWAVADDGTRIPISYVHRVGVPRDASAPCLLYGYGSYEISIDPGFSPLRLSLLDRGFVFAIAHIRGGGEMGRRWYENGKFLAKSNTFTDFIACAEHLVAERFTAPERLVARGGSAGGLLMGAVANLRPDLFAAIVAEVPFVDVLTTMLDEALPLTVTEWEEWGNPQEREFYDYMKTYAPYDNVSEQPYPAMLVTAGLNDPRVSYWEPAKWVARLRERSTSDKPILLKTEMGAGHGGPSGRYDAWKDEAFVYAFILDQLGLG